MTRWMPGTSSAYQEPAEAKPVRGRRQRPGFLPKLYNGLNRTFWMFSYEGTRQSNAIANTAVVPAEDIRRGDFSRITLPGFRIVDPYTKVPFPGNMIPANRISSFGKAFADLYPAPNAPDPARNYYAQAARRIRGDMFATRLDHRITAGNSLFGRLTINNPYDRSPGQGGVFTGFDSIQQDANMQAVVGDTHVFSPNIVNELNVGFVRFRRIATHRTRTHGTG